ncbi:hypothetical protein [Pedobacter faecalis]|uniref:hypothetical protein n=1 Tax=Pedobacter faecalis TaxID=3041495 RepID=UPI00254CF813|nr:hypothetical protein [Pedobacter sp. ELA7]
MIKIEYQTDLVDTKFKQPSVNNHAGRIKQSADQIGLDLAFAFKVTDREELTYEHAVELHRLLSHFIALGVDRTREFMDAVDSASGTSDGTLIEH